MIKILQISPKNITISDGEPLVKLDIWTIMDYLRSRFDGNCLAGCGRWI
ncbi:TPA: hypothetical protein ACKOR7_003307 [Clostridioides difficile]